MSIQNIDSFLLSNCVPGRVRSRTDHAITNETIKSKDVVNSKKLEYIVEVPLLHMWS